LQSGDHAPTPDQLPDILTALSPKELADAIWSFAKQGIHPPSDVMDAVSAEVLSKLPQFRPSADWLDSFIKAAQANLFQFTPTEMSNIIWALAKLGKQSACWAVVCTSQM
ncbi:uncharacterized protein HaLaN_06714, partial [Haematococcus lacustris]